MQLTVLLINL